MSYQKKKELSRLEREKHCFVVVDLDNGHYRKVVFKQCDGKQAALNMITSGVVDDVQRVFILTEDGETEEYIMAVNGFKMELVRKEEKKIEISEGFNL